MELKRAVQTAVVGLQDIVPPMAKPFRTVYRVALRSYAALCETDPQVESLYLRNSLAEGHWVPGLSDIDLTVVRRQPRSEAALEELRSFWLRSQRLARRYPMLGEVDVLDRRALDCWASDSIRGYETGTWKLVQGKPTLEEHYRATDLRLREDALHEACENYFAHLLPRVIRSSESAEGLVERRLILRIGDKVARYASRYPLGGAGEAPEGIGDDARPLEVLAISLTRLADAIRRFEGLAPATPVATAWRDSVERIGRLEESARVDLGELENHLDRLHGIWLSGPITLVALCDGLEPQALRETTRAACSFLRNREGTALLICRSMLGFLLRLHLPFQYTDFLRHVRTAHGPHPLDELEVPSAADCERHLLRLLPQSLAFPTSRELLLSRGPRLADRTRRRFRLLLVTKHWLQGTSRPPLFEDSLEGARRADADLADSIESMTKTQRNGRAAPNEGIGLLLRLAREAQVARRTFGNRASS